LRYAILFSGMSFRRHVNNLEFCYRTLVDHLGFAVANIHVLNYDGSLRAFGDPEEEPVGLWPGNDTPYRMVVNAEGSCSAFRAALVNLGTKVCPDDDVFINTTGHGGHHGEGYAPDLLTYPYSKRYNCRDFCADLATLPRHRSMMVLMSQCFGGGFNESIIASSPAAQTFVASATSETGQSFMSLDDGNWDAFQRNCVAALGGYDVDGSTLDIVRDIGASSLDLRNAFTYAATCAGRSPYDSPHFTSSYSAAVVHSSAPEAIPQNSFQEGTLDGLRCIVE
jgi:hypothetical protein